MGTFFSAGDPVEEEEEVVVEVAGLGANRPIPAPLPNKDVGACVAAFVAVANSGEPVVGVEADAGFGVPVWVLLPTALPNSDEGTVLGVPDLPNRLLLPLPLPLPLLLLLLLPKEKGFTPPPSARRVNGVNEWSERME